jgi:hypothetical protein
MSIIGTVPPPTDARYSPDDAPDPSAPSVPQTSPFMGNFTDAQHPDSPRQASTETADRAREPELQAEP